MKKWIVKCWLNLPDVEDETHYDTYDEAFKCRNELEAMQPENKYEVEEIELHEEEESDLGSWLLYATDEIRTAQTQKEQNEIIKQLCGLKSFRDFIKDNYYIVYNLRNDNKIKVRERVFPKSMLDSQGFKEESEWVGTHEEPPYPKPPVEKPYKIGQDFEDIAKNIQKNRRELGICPVCGCPDYVAHYLKEMGLTDDLWKVFRKCKNCGVIRGD